MDNIIPIRVDQSEIMRLDTLIVSGRFRNRNDGIRSALRLMLEKSEDPNLIRRKFAASIAANSVFHRWPKRVAKVYLYGSVSRGQITEESDIDIAIVIDKIPLYQERIAVIEDLIALMPEWSPYLSIQYFSIRSFAVNSRVKGNIEYNIKTEGLVLLPAGNLSNK